MSRQVFLEGHVDAVHNFVGEDGKSYCHLLLVGAAGDVAVQALKSAAIIVDTADDAKSFAKAPAALKDRRGKPRHEFLGQSLAVNMGTIDPSKVL